MPSRLTQFQQRTGLSDEGIAALLTQETGRPVKVERVEGVRKGGDRKLPKSWAAVFSGSNGSPPDEPLEGQLDLEHDGDLGPIGADDPPAPGPNNPRRRPQVIVPVDPLDWRDVRTMITQMYETIGTGVGMIRRNPRVAEAFRVSAPILADDWIALAKVDPRVRAMIEKMMVVGPGGKLAMDHAILVGKVISLSGPADAPPPRADAFVDPSGSSGNGADGSAGRMDEARTAPPG